MKQLAAKYDSYATAPVKHDYVTVEISARSDVTFFTLTKGILHTAI
jgi:hypothetical protein